MFMVNDVWMCLDIFRWLLFVNNRGLTVCIWFVKNLMNWRGSKRDIFICSLSLSFPDSLVTIKKYLLWEENIRVVYSRTSLTLKSLLNLYLLLYHWIFCSLVLLSVWRTCVDQLLFFGCISVRRSPWANYCCLLLCLLSTILNKWRW